MKGPGGVDVRVCEGCLALLDSMAFLDGRDVPSDPEVLDVLDVDEEPPPCADTNA